MKLSIIEIVIGAIAAGLILLYPDFPGGEKALYAILLWFMSRLGFVNYKVFKLKRRI